MRNACGNMVVILALILTGIFAVGGFAIDSAIYLLKRQELQTLAESIATGAALSLPNKSAAERSAEQWFEVLRNEDGRELAQKDALEVSFKDNQKLANENTPYQVDSIRVRVKLNYEPRVFPISSSLSSISVVGEATAQLAPTDVVLVVENSASLYEDESKAVRTFNNAFGPTIGRRYAAQCFSPPTLNFKKGVLAMYDQLSQLGTYRVAIVSSGSRTGDPLILAQLGETSIPASNLEYDGDQPHYHSTRCAAATEVESYQVPQNPNAAGNVWRPRARLSNILPQLRKNDFSLLQNQRLLTREAIWVQQSGFSSESGFFHPRYFFSQPGKAVELAEKILQDSRRKDGQRIARRVIIVFGDDAGKLPTETNDANWKPFCDRQNAKGVDLAILYFGHNQELAGHDYSSQSENGRWVQKLRERCQNSSVTFVENSPANDRTPLDFSRKTAPMAALGLKQAELVR